MAVLDKEEIPGKEKTDYLQQGSFQETLLTPSIEVSLAANSMQLVGRATSIMYQWQEIYYMYISPTSSWHPVEVLFHMPNELYATSLIFHFIAETTAFPESLCYSEETLALRKI